MKYHLFTYGCQMNKSDSERLAGFLEGLGLAEAAGPEEADLAVLNTCSVRQSAEDRVFGQVNNLAQLKKTNPRLVVAVTGCLPGRDKDGALRKKMPEADLFFPIIDLPRLPEMLKNFGFEISDSRFQNEDYLSIAPRYQNQFSAFIPVQTGCNNFCAYCVVPFARGPEKNRLSKEILAEAAALAEKGVLEITLLGQVVNNYRAPDAENFSPKNPFKNHFAALLWEINQMPNLKRVHFTAADPQFMNDEIIEALTLPKQVNYLHLPVQSGSNRILKRMNRKYALEKYLEIINQIKKTKPGIALGTDIIVGFPGETEEDFQETVELYRRADFDIAYLARYSPRSGTAAFKMADDVSQQEKERRWSVLQKLMEETALRKNQAHVGRTMEVLVEKNRSSGVFSGNSREMKLVEFESGEDLVGRIVEVKIDRAEEWRLLGRLAPP